MNTRHVVVGLVTHKKKVLILKRSENDPTYPDMWEFISWVSREKATPKIDAVKRHICHATGLSLSEPYAGKKFRVASVHSTLYMHPFIFQADSDEVTLLPEKHESYRWVRPQDIGKYALVQDLDNCLKLLSILLEHW